MIFTLEDRMSDSPFVERIWRAQSQRSGDLLSIAMSHWEMVVSRYQDSTDIVCNADMRVAEIRQVCRLPNAGQRLMRAALAQLNLSARTITDLAGCEKSASVPLTGALYASQLFKIDSGVDEQVKV